jgi:hypothetical protein
MKLTFDKMKTIFPCLNRMPVSDRQVYRAFRKFRADVFYMPLRNNGYFIPSDKSLSGKLEIYINSKLNPLMQRFTAIHELVHVANHAALNSLLFSLKDEPEDFALKQERFLRARHEFEAQAIAALSLLPAVQLGNGTPNLFDDYDRMLPKHVWQLRFYLRETFRY